MAKGAESDWELYDIGSDRSEQNNLAGEQPERVMRLAEIWTEYAERANVLPLTPYRKKKENENENSFNRKKRRFNLEQHQDVDRKEAPYVVKRGFTFSSSVSSIEDGVLAAQGGASFGWSVYFKDKRLVFALTQKNKRTLVSSDSDLENAANVSVTLSKAGQVTLYCNDKQIGSGQVKKLITQQPEDGLQVGRDAKGLVGEYDSEFKYPGTLTDVQVLINLE